MCVTSMVMDHYYERWRPLVPTPIWPPAPTYVPVPMPPLVTPDEVAEFRKLLDRAREYDRKHNEPDCELEEKQAKVRKVAKELGLEIDFV